MELSEINMARASRAYEQGDGGRGHVGSCAM